MRRHPKTLAILIALASAATFANAAPDPSLNNQVNQSLKKGAGYLLALNHPAEDKGQSGLVLYALLAVADSIDDPRLGPNSPDLAPLVQAVIPQLPETTREAAFKALALSRLPVAPDLKVALNQARDFLLRTLLAEGGFSNKPGEKNWVMSDAAWGYAALASLEDAGLDIDPKVWKTADRFFTTAQLKDGGWPVAMKNSRSDASSIAAGLTGLCIARSRVALEAKEPREAPGGSPMDRGLKRLASDFEIEPLGSVELERLASSTGLSTIGGVDWYRTRAEELLKAQRTNGSWPEPGGLAILSGDSPEATASSLLLLSRGRAPVIFSKLDYSRGGSGGGESKPEAWNVYPRDDANLTAWLSLQVEKHLNWQVVTLEGDSPERAWQGTLDSPILLITGKSDPNFTTQELAKLRRYVHSGGLILSVANNGDQAFTDAITKKYAPLLADKRYEMRAMPANHEIFDAALFGRIPSPPQLFSMSNGIREWWIHSPTDLAASWQGRKFGNRDQFMVPANLLRYATGNGSVRNRFEGPVDGSPSDARVVRTIKLAQFVYEGNYDPEPAAWQRLAALAPARFRSAVEITPVRAIELDAEKLPVLHMTGTDAFALADADIAALKKYLEAGGTLIADAGGASAKFTASFTELAQKLYPGEKLTDLAINDPLYNGALADSFRLTEVQYRKYALLKMKERQVKPHVEAINVAGRHVILFSPVDITSGLLGTQTWGIQGYTPDSAFALARNMLLYAAAGGNFSPEP